MAETLKLTAKELIEIRSATPDRLEVEVTYGPGGSPPPRHFHPSQDERFEVLEGALRVRVEGQERELRAGETLDIPRGRVHQMWNPGDEPVRVRWETAPALRTEQWFRGLDSLNRSGKVRRDGSPSLLGIAPMLAEYRDVFRLAGPDWLLRPLLAALAALGRARR